MRAAALPDQQAVALRIVAAVGGPWVHRDKAAIGVLRPARRYALRDDPGFGILAKMHHFCPGIGLLGIVGDGDGIELTLAVIPAQDAGRVLPRDRRSGFDLRPHHLAAGTPAICPLGDKVVNAANAVFVAGIPVLHGGILHFGIVQNDDLDHGGMQLMRIALGGGAAFQIADVGTFFGNDQRPFELARVFGIDPEIGGQFHRAAHAFGDVNEGTIREDRTVERGKEIVGLRHHGPDIFLHQLGVFAHRLRDCAENDARLCQLRLEGGANRHAVKHGIHGDAARLVRAFDTSQKHLFLQRNSQLGIGCQQLRVHLVQRLRLAGHAFRFGVVELVLIIDFGVVQHRPAGFFHLDPAPVGRKTPLQHPLGLSVLVGNQTDDVFVQPLGREVHLDVGFPAVLVLAGHGLHGLNRLAINAIAHFGLQAAIKDRHDLSFRLSRLRRSGCTGAMPGIARGPGLDTAQNLIFRHLRPQRKAYRRSRLVTVKAHGTQHPA